MNYIKVILPNFDVNESEATVTAIKVNNGEFVEAQQALFLTENTKAVNEIITPESGFVMILCNEFETKKAGDTLALIFSSKEELEKFDVLSLQNQTSRTIESIDNLNITKKARELAEKLGVDLNNLALNNKGNVIKTKDVQEFYDNAMQKKNEPIKKSVFKYDRERIVIIGAGNGAEVVCDILLDDYDKIIVGMVDDNVKELKNYDYPVLECGVFDFPDKIDRTFYDAVIISLGSTLKTMKIRKQIFDDYCQKEIRFINAISKDAEIRRGVKIGTGNLIGARSYIGTMTQIGDNNSISYGTFIGHHNIIGNNNLLAPGLFTSGSVTVGNDCIIPAGIVTRNLVDIGNNVILPVGYVVANSIPDNTIIQQNIK